MDTASHGPKTFKLLPALALATAALLLALLVIWATRPSEEPRAPNATPAQAARSPQPLSPPQTAPPLPRHEAADLHSTAPPDGAPWEERLDAILTSDESNRESVMQLLRGFDQLPQDAQSEYIAHALNLCEDGDFGFLTNLYLYGATNDDVRQQIFDDALNRSDEIKLPLMARTMATPNHPMQGEAKEMLCLYLELDPMAVNQIDWHERVRAYLRENSAGE